jgi:hypothetical protein
MSISVPRKGTKKSTDYTDKKNLFIIILFFCAIAILMLPLRNQTAGDDFAYAQSVNHFLKTGDVKVSEWSGPSLIFLIFWGALFSKILGFSYTSLHFSVIVMLLVLLTVLYKLLRETGLQASKSLYFTLYFFSIPWILQFTYTFLTDIPFLTLEVLTLYFYTVGIKRASLKYLFFGSVFSILGYLTRQLGLVFPLAVFLVLIINYKNYTKSKLIKTIGASLVVPIIVFALYQLWLSNPQNITIPQIYYANDLNRKFLTLLPFTNIPYLERVNFLKLFLHRIIVVNSQAVGLVSPLSLLALFNLKKILKKWKTVFVGLTFILILYGIDFITFRKEFVLGYPEVLFRYQAVINVQWFTVWKIMLAFSIPIFFSMVILSIPKVKEMKTYQQFLLISFIGILLLTCTSVLFWGKYVMPLIPFFLIFISYWIKDVQFPKKLFLLLTFILLLNSLQMTKLRYDENGFAQQIAEKLRLTGIPAENIYPNLEWSWPAYYVFETRMQEELKRVNNNKKIANVRLVNIESYNYLILSDFSLKYLKIPNGFGLMEKFKIRSLWATSHLFLYKRISF